MPNNEINNYDSFTLSYIHILPVGELFVVFDDKLVRKGVFKTRDDALSYAHRFQLRIRIPIVIHRQNGDVESVMALTNTRAITNGETSRVYRRSRPINQRSLSVFNG